MKLHGNSVALVKGMLNGEYRDLGTAFCFLKQKWFVTAKHVILEEHGLLRDKLSLNIGGKLVTPSDIWIHNERDIALIDIGEMMCPEPHYPAHWNHEKDNGLFKLAYSPLKSKEDNRPVFLATHVKKFETSERIRQDGCELMFEFEDQGAEGGNSGGPIFSTSGGVVGIIIDGVFEEAGNLTKATDVKVLLELIELNSDILTKYSGN